MDVFHIWCTPFEFVDRLESKREEINSRLKRQITPYAPQVVIKDVKIVDKVGENLHHYVFYDID